MWLTGAVSYGHSFTLSSVSIQSRQRDLVLLIVLHPLQDRSLTLTAHPQLKHTHILIIITHYTLLQPSFSPEVTNRWIAVHVQTKTPSYLDLDITKKVLRIFAFWQSFSIFTGTTFLAIMALINHLTWRYTANQICEFSAWDTHTGGETRDERRARENELDITMFRMFAWCHFLWLDLVEF